MCGIVAYIGSGPVLDRVVRGLRRLEYRGYDSAGIAVVGRGRIAVAKQAGRIDDLAPRLCGGFGRARAAIGHTRWATHGPPSSANAHPHADCSGRVAIVHNGIIENHAKLRASLQADGHRFSSDTDSEVVAHLIEELGTGDLERSVAMAIPMLEGSFAIAAVSADQPDVVVVARRESPLVVCSGEGWACAASDVTGVEGHDGRLWALHDDTIAVLSAAGLSVSGSSGGRSGGVDEIVVDWDQSAAERGGYETFMRKEIAEQPRALDDTLRGRSTLGGLDLQGEVDLGAVDSVTLLGCGSSAHACLLGELVFESLAGVRARTDLASEFRSRRPQFGHRDVAVVLSQSGETADSIAAARLARESGAVVVAVTNTQGSRLAREADAVLFTRAGPEVSVAATKTFTVQVAALTRLAIEVAFLGGGPADQLDQALASLLRAGAVVRDVLSRAEDVEAWREAFTGPAAMFIGRGPGYPVALEAALKLKEIAYVQAHGYAAGEMKHGPIALVERGTPVAAMVAPGEPGWKTLANLEEVRARGAYTLAVEPADADRSPADRAFVVPGGPLTYPIGAAVPAQLLAHAVARDRGIELDRPRNLAKSVTVE